MGNDWRASMAEALDRIRTRYDYIGRKSGAPFIAITYAPEVEQAALREWHTQASALRPEFDVRTVDVLDCTHRILDELGIDNVIDALEKPMPGSDTKAELAEVWVSTLARAVKDRLAEPGVGRPVVSVERLAALYPVAGPRDIMQRLWDTPGLVLEGPVVVLVPGRVTGPRTYGFLAKHEELMYRGDLL